MFIEGRPQLGEHDPGSLDILFWKGLFNKYLPELRVHFKCYGSKEHLHSIAEIIIKNDLNTVIVAMDRDLDPELGQALKHPSIIYTYGYSWESDVWCFNTIQSIIETHSLVQPVPQDIQSLLRASYDDFSKCAKRVARVNVTTALVNAQPVVLASEYKALLDCGKSAIPTFRRKYFKQKLSDYPRDVTKNYVKGDLVIDNQKHCLGHLTAYFGYHLTCRILRRLGHKAKIDFRLMSSFAVQAFHGLLSACGSRCSSYYAACFQAVVGA